MKPKEYAQDLLALFEYEDNLGIAENTGIEGIDKKKAKQCALIAVDEILQIGCIEVPYWQEVKQEIKKL
jgi:hypothetical protein